MMATSITLPRRVVRVGARSWKKALLKRNMRLMQFTKSAPSKPQTVAKIAKANSSQNSKLASLSGNSMKPEVFRVVKPLFVTFARTAAIIVPRNACQVRGLFQYVAASSILKRMPPTGAPNAAATPMAQPCDTNSHRFLWPDKTVGQGKDRPMQEGPSANHDATMPPMCAKGPSVPAKSPDEVTKTRPIDLHSQALKENAPGCTIPLRKALISGMPLPPA
mmetsp:Transcript_69641/g.123283  ORF Transcript_69641/g.123283 Transcript_69641/m.123283 type:complete len:220 (-) Transcript_69641:1132-1791(-)